MAARRAHPLPDPPLQLITGAWRDAADLEARVASVLRGGIRWIQLRAKERTASEVYDAARRIAALAGDAGALFVVNDRVDIAIACGAGGVHLPEVGMEARSARSLLGERAWIARSVHSVEAIVEDDAVDAFQLGPVFDTPSKRAFGTPLGLDAVAGAARLPGRTRRLIAVGGITAARIVGRRRAGAEAVSIIGGIWDVDDVEAAARTALAFLRRAHGPAAGS